MVHRPRLLRWFIPLVFISTIGTLPAQQPPALPPGSPPVMPPGSPPVKPAVLPGMPGSPPVMPPASPPAVPPSAPGMPGQAGMPGMPPNPGASSNKDGTPITWPKEVGGRPLDAWIKDLSSSDPTAREKAIKAIPVFGPDAYKKATYPIINLLDDSDPGVRVNAILTVITLGVENTKDIALVVRKLISSLKNTTPGSVIRLHTTRALIAIGPDAHTAIETLVTIAKDPSWETRAAVAQALGRIGGPVYDDKPVPPGATPPIIRHPSKMAQDRLVFELLKDSSAAVRREAIQALLTIGPPSDSNPAAYVAMVQPYMDAVKARLRPANPGSKEPAEKDPGIRIWLTLLAIQYDDRTMDSGIKSIASYINDPSVEIRSDALNALSVLGPLARPALLNVREALRHKEPEIQLTALTTLLAMADAAKPAIPDVEDLIRTTKNMEMKELATKALQAMKDVKLNGPQMDKR